ncbi:MAG: hypothetical protein OEZ47_17210, partial [Gammaproteobacteria bacterium]|nr:hypothetical protein [Gammaproteobacteria bacterium]
MITTLKRDTPYPWDYTSKYFEKTFIKDLAKSLSNHMENPSAISALMDDISNTAQTIFFRNLGFVEDRASQLNFLMTSYLLASYMHLKQLSLNIEVKALLSSVFKGVGAFWIKWPVRISLYFSKDRLATLKRASIDRTRVAYGSTFQIDMEESGQKGFVSVVKKCGYFDFFKRE